MKTILTLTILLYLFITKGFSQDIVADFQVNDSSGCVPVTVIFENKTVHANPVSYHWDFGNGATSDEENPEIIFTQAGFYNITLVAYDSNSSDTIVKENYIEVYDNINPLFDILQDTIGCVPYAVQFVNNTPNENIVYRHWDFGDGVISNEDSPNHSYLYNGNYSVSLYVIDINGCQGLKVKNDYIEAHKPTADFYTNDTTSCSGELDVSFVNISGDNLTYLWELEDGVFSNEKNPQYHYETGIYTPKLIVTDQYKCKDTTEKPDYIKVTEVVADFSIDKDTTCIDEQLSINNNSNFATTFYWDFGDGSFSTEESPTHSYSNAGNYTITLRVGNNNSCVDSISKIINVEQVEADFGIDESFFCEFPAIANYTDNSINANTYNWKFKDTLSSNDKNPVVEYYTKGSFNTTLTVTSKHGCSSTKTISNCVEVTLPYAYFTPNEFINTNELIGCIPLEIGFESDSKYATNRDSIIDYHWDFGNGDTDIAENPTYTYTNLGVFQVTLNVTTARGCSSIYGASAKTGTEQVADFSQSHTDTICASEPVIFTNLSHDMNLISQSYWMFGDDKTSYDTHPIHIFTDTGYMTVELLVYNNGCPAKITKDSLLYIKGPVTEITKINNCDDNYNLFFNSNAIDATSFLWNFGDGETDNVENPYHRFSDRGKYIVNLTTYNENTGCSFTSTEEFWVTKPEANFTISNQIGCKNLNSRFDSGSSKDISLFENEGANGKYLWDFGDEIQSFKNTDTVEHVFSDKGTFNVKLLIKDRFGCSDSIYKQVKVYNPDVNFSASDFVGCMPMDVSFSNQTITDTILTDFKWEFGDGSYSTDENPSHTYNNYAMYDVKLVVTNVLGCKDSLKINNYIEAMIPDPTFVSPDRTLCVNDTTKFSCINPVDIVSYKWNFGNGGISTDSIPEVIYDKSGEYNVSLTLIDSHGCDSTLIMTNFISVQNYPNPNFEAPDTYSPCYPYIVEYHNLTDNSDIADYFWEFGDGYGISHNENPIYTYVVPGNFTVTLTATTTHGCSNAIQKEGFVKIDGPYAEILSPDSVCKNTDVELVGINKKNVNSLTWYAGDGCTSSRDTFVHKYKNAGMKNPVLFLTSDDVHTCDKFFYDTVKVNEHVVVFDSANSVISGCVPHVLKYSELSENSISWNWNFGNGNTSVLRSPTQYFSQPGNYTTSLITIGENGCSDTINFTSKIYDIPNVSITKDTLICEGESIMLSAEGGDTYKWYPNENIDNTNIPNPTVMPDRKISYSVEVTNSHNCINYKEVYIDVINKPTINLQDTTVVIGERINWSIDSSSIESIKWTPDIGISCTDCFNPVFTATEPITYNVTYIDKKGCFKVSKSINIDIINEYTIDVPTAFTPNGDCINDIIYVKGWGVESLVSFTVFNRFGEVVFVTNSVNEGWDGTYKGKPQPIETYSYVAVVKGYNGKFLTKKGVFKLIR